MRTDGRLARADQDAILPVSIGTAVWLVALVVLLARRDSLSDAGREWWILAAAVGVVSGAGGLVFLRWRAGRRRGGG
jgi:hypothetical protein